MEVRSNSAGGNLPERMRIDITKPTREAIKKSLPDLPASVDSDQTPVDLSKRIQNARAKEHGEQVQRLQNAREGYSAQMAQRISNAREQAMADRIQNARLDRAERVDNARAMDDSERADRIANARAQAGQDQLDISANARGLSVDDQDSARIEELKQRHEAGSLNVDELIARAAHKLLGGE